VADPAEAVEFLRSVAEAESTNRAEALDDLRFRFGDQWPTTIQNSRTIEERPCLTINETDSYLRKVVNQMRQQRPRITAHPVDDQADPKVAKVITGITRHVEENSDAANAYDLASEFAVTMGWGYWRLRTDYISEDSFYQDIYVDPVDNPFSVYFDTNSTLPDGSDAEKALITDTMRKTSFLKQYPGAMMGGFTQRATGDATTDWVSKDDIRLAEYYKVDKKPAKLVALSNGDAFYEDELPPAELLRAANITIKGDRQSYKRIVTWYKFTAFEELDKRVLPGRWIPVVPVYGVNIVVGGKRMKFGAVRFAKDPQRMVNFWQTAITEGVALAAKAKWLMAAGQDEGFENEWAQANRKATPVLHYNLVDVDGKPAPPPQRVAPEPPPEGAMAAAMASSQNLARVLGIFDPMMHSAQRKSDRTINAEAQQVEITNYHFYDNLTRSLKHTGRIELNWAPKIWDTTRVQRIIGEDGRPSLVKLNEKRQIEGPNGEAINQVLNDLTVGIYDVVMQTGPGYNSRRQESVATLMQLMETPLGEKIAAVADDVIVRQMDFNGAEVVADRLAAANPLAQIDETSDVPPKAQMMIKGLQQQVQKMGQALQQAGIELKFGIAKEQMKQDGETRRTLMKVTGEAHETEQTANFKQHDTEVRAVTQQNVAEIKALAALLTKHMDTAALREEIAARDREQQRKRPRKSPSRNKCGGGIDF
jgi:hypothetical protein